MFRGEEGMTLVELMIGAALSLVVLAGVLGTLVVADRAQVFGNRQSGAVSDSTVAVQQLELHVRNALAASNCDPTGGSCLALRVRTPQGTDESFQYRLEGREIVRYREVTSGTSTSFERDRVLADGVVNASLSPPVPLFECSPNAQLLHVELRVSTDPGDDEAFTQKTSLRPRNGVIGNC